MRTKLAEKSETQDTKGKLSKGVKDSGCTSAWCIFSMLQVIEFVFTVLIQMHFMFFQYDGLCLNASSMVHTIYSVDLVQGLHKGG
jgi:hypothetical protein